MVGTSVPVPGILSHDISFHTHLPGLSIVLGFNLQHRMGRWSQEGSVRHVGGSLALARARAGDPTVGDLPASWTFPSVSHGHPINNL